MSAKPKITGSAIRYSDDEKEPAAEDGCVWITEDDPHAGNCDRPWRWALYKLADESK